MQVREFAENDFSQICNWAQTGYDTEYCLDFFPKTGLIVDGIAAIFLYSTDSKVCFLENMISNREADKEQKDIALDLLLESAFKKAKDLGFRVVYASTNNTKVIVRAFKHGCSADFKYTLLTKHLNDPS